MVKPETRYRLSQVKTITTGTLTKIADAAYNPHCVETSWRTEP